MSEETPPADLTHALLREIRDETRAVRGELTALRTETRDGLEKLDAQGKANTASVVELLDRIGVALVQANNAVTAYADVQHEVTDIKRQLADLQEWRRTQG